MPNLFDQVRHIPHGAVTIAEWVGSGGQVASHDEAQTRADVCLECPLNGRSNPVTAAVAAAVRRHLEIKNKIGLRVQGEKRLGACEACGCILRLQIWQPYDKVQSEMTDDERAKLPEHCWKLK